jgi:HK97 family phage portal protein
MRSLRRAFRNASPVPHTAPSGPLAAMMGGVGRGDKVAQMTLYGIDGSLFGIVSRTSNSTAKVDWDLWRRNARDPKNRTQVTAHAALDVWNQPNPFMARQELVERTQQHVDLTGEGVWTVGRSPAATLPLELWPVRPDRIVPVPHPTEYMSGWCYFGPSGERIPLGLDEVIQMMMPDPLNPYAGLGPVSSVRGIAESRSAAIEWNRRWFLNSARPNGLIEFQASLSDVEFERWQKRWREAHQGVQAAHRVGILENAKWVDTSETHRDMEFTELLRLGVDEMRIPFGIHKASLGQSDDVNRANAEAARWLFAEDLLIPRLERIKGAINRKLLPMFDADPALEFDYHDPRPKSQEQENATMTSRVNAAMAIVSMGGDWDETLAAFELPPIPRSMARLLTLPDPAAPAVEPAA